MNTDKSHEVAEVCGLARAGSDIDPSHSFVDPADSISLKGENTACPNKKSTDVIKVAVGRHKAQTVHHELSGSEGSKVHVDISKVACEVGALATVDTKCGDTVKIVETHVTGYPIGDPEVDPAMSVFHTGSDLTSFHSFHVEKQGKGTPASRCILNGGVRDPEHEKSVDGCYAHDSAGDKSNVSGKDHTGEYGHLLTGSATGGIYTEEVVETCVKHQDSPPSTFGHGVQGGKVEDTVQHSLKGNGGAANLSCGTSSVHKKQLGVVPDEVVHNERANTKEVTVYVRSSSRGYRFVLRGYCG